MAIDINKRISQVLGSSTLAITAKAKELSSKGIDVVNFAGGEPDFDTPDSIKKAAIRAIDEGKTKYTPSTGTPQLRQLIAEKFLRDHQLTYSPNQIAVSCGAKHSIFNLIQVLADEKDEVLIPSPYWVSYPEMVKIAGATAKIIPTTVASQFKLTPDHFQKSLSKKSRILILNSPSNPTGMLYSRSELEPIAEICVKHGIIVISDEIYEKLIFDAEEYTSFASLGKDVYDLTFTVNGVSKAYSMTGWRIGYAAGSQDVMGFVKKLQDHSTSCPSAISQAAALQALNEPEEVVRKMRQEFKERRDLITSLLDNIPQIKYIRPEGAFYVFCDFSSLGPSMDVAQRIIEEANVAIIPGDGFGAPGYMRISFATSREKIEEGVKRIANWIQKNN